MNAPPHKVRLRRPTPHSALGRKLGRYELLTDIASGGMATVYVARSQGVAGFERQVAIKILHPHFAHEEDFVTMFLDEARLAASIRHPNVVSTLDIHNSDDAGYYIVMDYIEGDHLGALLQSASACGERVPPAIVIHIILDALSGLGAAHALKDSDGQHLHLVHRDVSPHNVLVGVDGVARLTDFGVAKAEVRLSSTREGQFKGKLAYMAPEQAAEGETDQRSDLFSMGVVLWEALTGRRLFRARNNAATLHRLLHEPILPPSSVWAELAPLDGVLQTALERRSDARFQHAQDFIDALEKARNLAGYPSMGRRDVAQMVRTYAAQKLQEERERIRLAGEALSTPARHPQAARPSRITAARDDNTIADSEARVRLRTAGTGSTAARLAREASTPSTSMPNPGPPARSRAWWWGMALLVTLLVVAPWLVVLLSRPEHPQTPVSTRADAAHPPDGRNAASPAAAAAPSVDRDSPRERSTASTHATAGPTAPTMEAPTEMTATPRPAASAESAVNANAKAPSSKKRRKPGRRPARTRRDILANPYRR
ncbi:MAG: serine/threonine protein kinase [Polyangiales bacterium]